MPLYRKKTKPIRAHQVNSMDVNDLPDWAQTAQRDEEITVWYPKYLPLAMSFIPFDDDAKGARDWILGQWIIEASLGSQLDCALVDNAWFLEQYELVEDICQFTDADGFNTSVEITDGDGIYEGLKVVTLALRETRGCFEFSEVAWSTMTPQQARDIAKELTDAADKAERENLGYNEG